MSHDKMAEAATVWSWMLPQHYLDDRLASEYVNVLFKERKYEAAARAWALYLGDRRNGYLESNWLFNGDFEFEPSQSAFDWRMESLNDDVKVSVDPNVAHTGAHSLRLRFGGKENVNYSHTSLNAFVIPGSYRFEAYVRTQEITTDQGIGFHIFDPEASARVDIRTEPLIGTADWKRIEHVIRVPRETKLLMIQVTRTPSFKFDSQIGGTAWIDSLKLSKLKDE